MSMKKAFRTIGQSLEMLYFYLNLALYCILLYIFYVFYLFAGVLKALVGGRKKAETRILKRNVVSQWTVSDKRFKMFCCSPMFNLNPSLFAGILQRQRRLISALIRQKQNKKLKREIKNYSCE